MCVIETLEEIMVEICVYAGGNGNNVRGGGFSENFKFSDPRSQGMRKMNKTTTRNITIKLLQARNRTSKILGEGRDTLYSREQRRNNTNQNAMEKYL